MYASILRRLALSVRVSRMPQFVRSLWAVPYQLMILIFHKCYGLLIHDRWERQAQLGDFWRNRSWRFVDDASKEGLWIHLIWLYLISLNVISFHFISTHLNLFHDEWRSPLLLRHSLNSKASWRSRKTKRSLTRGNELNPSFYPRQVIHRKSSGPFAPPLARSLAPLAH